MLLVKTSLRPSSIDGIGLFTDEFIAEGTPVWRYDEGFDMEISAAAIEKLPASSRRQMLKYAYKKPGSDIFFLCADDTRFFNHSSTPNVGSTSIDGEDIALRDIQPGEELTIDYFTFDAEAGAKLSKEAK